MKTFLVMIVALSFVGCVENGNNASTTGSSMEVIKKSPFPPGDPAPIDPDLYDFEITGAGVTYSADIHTYANPNYDGAQNETDITHYTIPDANPVSFTVTGRSIIANFTLNTGAGVLSILMKKNGVVVQSQTITTNATGISMSN